MVFITLKVSIFLQTDVDERATSDELITHSFLHKSTDLRTLAPLIIAAKKELGKPLIQ